MRRGRESHRCCDARTDPAPGREPGRVHVAPEGGTRVTSLIGQPIRRLEDARLLTGKGAYAADYNRPGQAYLAVLRSPYAHARIRSIDLDAARASPAVLLAYAGEDYLAAGFGLPPMAPTALGT